MAAKAFEDRMVLRRAMLRLAGVQLDKRQRFPKELEDQLRESILNCLECPSGEFCKAWLAKAPKGAAVPEFCANLKVVERLRDMGHVQEDPS